MRIFKQFLQKQVLLKITGIVILLGLYALLYKILIPRITAFGCMDDCNNFMGGYFLLHGKALFSQIFFNHAPFMAHISEFIFGATRPQNLYEIILRHRQFVMVFSLLCEGILLWRFGLITLPFATLYEFSKFYLAGDRFLAEVLIVYPLVYLLGIVFYQYFKKKVFFLDYLLAAISTWFVLFMREPYSIVVLLLYITLILRGTKKEKILSLVLFGILFCWTLFSYNLSEFWYNIVTVNQTTVAAENADSGFLGINIYKSFLYPLTIFFQGEWNFVRYIEMGLSALFIFTNIIFLWKKKWQWIVFLWITLGVANIRLVRPGHEYYGAFHLLPWYSLTIFITCLMLWEIGKWQKKLVIIGGVGFAALVVYLFVAKGSYMHDKINEQTEFITNYGNVLQVGDVVAALSTPKDTLFLDGSDDAIYLVAKKYSEYPYSWFTSLMPEYKKYTDARLKMLATNPPDFYYKACSNQTLPKDIPQVIWNNYIRLYNLKDPSCLWVKKTKLATITLMQWSKAGESLYFLQATTR